MAVTLVPLPAAMDYKTASMAHGKPAKIRSFPNPKKEAHPPVKMASITTVTA
jgi:hypothetical protein